MTQGVGAQKPPPPYELYFSENPEVFTEQQIETIRQNNGMTRKQVLRLLFETKLNREQRQVYN